MSLQERCCNCPICPYCQEPQCCCECYAIDNWYNDKYGYGSEDDDE